jgi:heme A synthase
MNSDTLVLISIQPVHRIALLVLSIALFVLVIELVRRELLKERYALLWLVTSALGVIMGVFPGIIEWITASLHFQLLTTLYAVSFTYTLGIVLGFSVIITKQIERNRILAQEVALLSNRLDKLEETHSNAE